MHPDRFGRDIENLGDLLVRHADAEIGTEAQFVFCKFVAAREFFEALEEARMDFFEMEHEIFPVFVGVDIALDDVLNLRGFGQGAGNPFGDIRDLLQDLVLVGNQKRIGGDFAGFGFEDFLVLPGL